MGILDFFKKYQPRPHISSTTSTNTDSKPAGQSPPDLLSELKVTSPRAITDELERAGYFIYDDPEDLPQLKEEIGEGLAKDGLLPVVETGTTKSRELDRRNYWLDGEDLFEEEGVIDVLERMSVFFNRAGVRMEPGEHIEFISQNDGWNRSMVLNDKKYEHFNEFNGAGWGEAAQRFADMLNDQLALQQSDERLYLINGGNDGRAVFLTLPLLEILRKYISDPEWQPMPTPEWCRFNNVEFKRII